LKKLGVNINNLNCNRDKYEPSFGFMLFANFRASGG